MQKPTWWDVLRGAATRIGLRPAGWVDYVGYGGVLVVGLLLAVLGAWSFTSTGGMDDAIASIYATLGHGEFAEVLPATITLAVLLAVRMRFDLPGGPAWNRNAGPGTPEYGPGDDWERENL